MVGAAPAFVGGGGGGEGGGGWGPGVCVWVWSWFPVCCDVNLLTFGYLHTSQSMIGAF